MFPKKTILLVLTAIILFGGCTNTRYMTDIVWKEVPESNLAG